MRAVFVGLVVLVISACGRVELPPPSMAQRGPAAARDGVADVDPFLNGANAASLTFAVRGAELCNVRDILEWIVRGEDARELATRLRMPSAPVCVVTLSTNLVDFVAFFPGASLAASVQTATFHAVATPGGVLVARPGALQDMLAELDHLGTNFPVWARVAELEEGHLGDRPCVAVARLAPSPPIEGFAFQPKIDRMDIAIHSDGTTVTMHGEPAVLLDFERTSKAHLAALGPTDLGEWLAAVAPGDAIDRVLRLLKIPDAYARGDLRFQSHGDRLVIDARVALETDVRKAFLSGVVGAILVPTIAKFHRRSRTAEARIQVARMFDAAAAAMYADPHEPSTFRGCPLGGTGSAGTTPALTVACTRGPLGRCFAAEEARPGAYEPSSWSENKLWRALRFQQRSPHFFHYDFAYAYDAKARGCMFTAQAFGDLDDDGVFSTFERAAAANAAGVVANGLYIDQEIE